MGIKAKGVSEQIPACVQWRVLPGLFTFSTRVFAVFAVFCNFARFVFAYYVASLLG